MKYYKLEEFIDKTKSSKSTIYRFYVDNKDLFGETKMKGKWRVYPIEHIRYFDSEVMFEENKMLRSENKSMRNLIDCLTEKNSLEYTLWGMDWSYFLTVAYKNERNKKSCFRQMHGLYNTLIDKYGADTALNMFFTTEPFANREGYHNHFMIYVEDKTLHKKVIADVNQFFSYDRLDVAEYDQYKAGLWYMSKGGLVGEDYDILGNNLGYTNKKSA
ncbi:MAG: hypothetical protein DI539_02085 [Flavobacterium psychrophilum]|nr:MAG: hypothetical protein DI539_02085 [Flavobacterium psychrophilum]